MEEDIANNKYIHTGHRNRMRQRVKKEGLNSCTEHQVLEYILSFVIARKDTNELAHNLINKFGSLSNVLDAPYEALINTKGLGEVSATFLCTINEIMNYCSKIRYSNNVKILCASDAYKVLKPHMANLDKEVLVVLCLSASDRLIHHEIVDFGDDAKVATKTDRILQIVKHNNAKKIILAHNHPVGEFGPSNKDVIFTKTLFVALKLAGQELVDHYIFTRGGENYSFRNYGLLDSYNMQLANMLDK